MTEREVSLCSQTMVKSMQNMPDILGIKNKYLALMNYLDN